MKDLTSNLTKEIKSKLTREHFNNQIYKFCRDVDYYMERGMNKKDAIGYVKFFYRNKNEWKTFRPMLGGSALL